ncbi:RICIN domain-containing protein [Nocardiopsis sp. EMB25]|uniref:RICIN domain-containing protein n=1 Tax=Nocardiopsis sp. EMB25 TaxID=2835867 RepID=UPI002284AEB1|nr:RICIN domain-containing protein [Nocardiopsis sp. EMB25]MCY9783632.1 RICIN domain-containing protein [Nocardiopsis sp. EMB25]
MSGTGSNRILTRTAAAVMMGVCVAATGVVLSPARASVAQFAPDCSQEDVYCDIQLLNRDSRDSAFFQISPSNGDPGTEMILYDTDTHRQKYTFLANRDGTFSIVNQDTGLCVDARMGTKSDRLYLDHCDDSESQDWYLQPTTATVSGQQTDRWRLRHASDDKCVNIYREHFGNFAHVGLYDCHSPTQLNDSWVLETAPDADLTHERRMELATHRALWMWDDRSGVIRDAKFRVGSDAPAKPSDPEIVSQVWRNGTSQETSHEFSWTHTTSYTNTVGGSLSLSTTIGTGEASPVQASVTVGIEVHYDRQWGEETAVSDSVTYPIRSGETGWVARAQLMKTVNGTWDITTDRGDSWVGSGIATVPAKDNTDGKWSTVAVCTTDGVPDPICDATRPQARMLMSDGA